MSEFCSMCGQLNDVPSRSCCSMCYGDSGSGHYYADWLAEQDRQQEERRIQEEAEYENLH